MGANAIETLSFEQALQELETIIRTLEGGGQSLEQSIELYTRGNQLRAHCDKKLQEAKLKIEKLIIDENGAVEGKEPIVAE